MSSETPGDSLPLGKAGSKNPSAAWLRAHALIIFIYAVIICGTAWRLYLPFLHNPLDLLHNDSLRHFESALNPGQDNALELIDPVGYQFWLSCVLTVTGKNHIAIAIYSGLLSAVTPWIWYKWLREVFQRKQDALVGYAILTVLPTWTNHFCYFLDSTILLPAGGIALWKTWQSVRQSRASTFRFASFFWAVCCAIKPVAVPFAAVALVWMGKHMHRILAAKAIPTLVFCAALIAAGYLVSPLKLFCRTGAINLAPTSFNSTVTYESGSRSLISDAFLVRGSKTFYRYNWSSPSIYPQPFEPFSNWKSPRQTECYARLELWRTFDQLRKPNYTCTIQQRLWYTVENSIYFFFGWSWPEQTDTADSPERFGRYVRYAWLPLTLFVFVMGFKRKRRDVLFVLFTLTTLFFLLEQGIIMEARYKKLWDGIAIATFISMFAPLRRTEEESITHDSLDEEMEPA